MTPTVTIRRAAAADAGFLLGVRAEVSASRFQPLRIYTPDRLEAILTQRAVDPLDAQFAGKAQWVIDCGPAAAGWITLDVTNREHGVASVGYTVTEALRGQGVASRALTLLIGIAFDPDNLDMSRLEAVAAVDNVASHRVLLANEFRETGIAKGLLVINGIRVGHMRFELVRNAGVSAQCPS